MKTFQKIDFKIQITVFILLVLCFVFQWYAYTYQILESSNYIENTSLTLFCLFAAIQFTSYYVYALSEKKLLVPGKKVYGSILNAIVMLSLIAFIGYLLAIDQLNYLILPILILLTISSIPMAIYYLIKSYDMMKLANKLDANREDN